MIGQKSLTEHLYNLSKNKQLPRFMILVGKPGSGKKMVVGLLKDYTGFDLVEVGNGVDDIRQMISTVYENQRPTIYAIYDADFMSDVAKNSMLKICEEPANSAFVIMTLMDIENTLETIKSRASIYYMDRYKPQEILDYAKSLVPTGFDEEDFIVNVCETPGQVKGLVDLGLSGFSDFIDLVFNNVHLVSGSNAFKIGSKLNLGDDESKYPLDLFFKSFVYKCIHNIERNPEMFSYGIRTTSKYLQDLRYSSLNKTMLFDSWLLELRDGWLDYAESNS